MSWLFSRALEEAYLAGGYSDGAPSAPLSAILTPQASLWHAKTTEFWSHFPSGMTCEHLTDDFGEAMLMSFLEGFPVKTSVPQDPSKDLSDPVLDCGQRWSVSSRRYNLDTCGSRTQTNSSEEDLIPSSPALPRWGTMRGGVCSALTTLELPTAETVSGFWPTPTASDAMGGPGGQRDGGANLRTAVAAAGARGPLNPDWIEWLMGWPAGWTELRPLEMVKFQQWCALHGKL